jgi:hypothetical protein
MKLAAAKVQLANNKPVFAVIDDHIVVGVALFNESHFLTTDGERLPYYYARCFA